MLAAAASAALIAFTPVVIHDSHERSPLTTPAPTPRSPAPPTHAPPPTAARSRPRPAAAGSSTGSTTPTRTRTAASSRPAATPATGSSSNTASTTTTSSSRPSTPSTREPNAAARAEVEFSGQPIVYAAHGSHASYFHAGVRDRTFPDPNDHADGKGKVTRPELVEITATSPPWMTYPDPWGNSRARFFIPGEQSSPLGPRFQPDRWNPETFATNADPCKPDLHQGRRMRRPRNHPRHRRHVPLHPRRHHPRRRRSA